jgi:hypothetical protein
MYTSRVGRNDVTPEWIRKTDDFVLAKLLKERV